MSERMNLEPMVEMYLFETSQLIDKLEQIIMRGESENDIHGEIDEIFRIMHTIKGNSMMMMYEEIANLAHSIEDLFDFFKLSPDAIEDVSRIFDLLLETVDFFKFEIAKIGSGDIADGTSDELVVHIKTYLASLKKGGSYPARDSVATPQRYFISPAAGMVDDVQSHDSEGNYPRFFVTVIHFEEGCELENVRAFSIIHGMKELVEEEFHFPADIIENENSVFPIRSQGFSVYYKTLERAETLSAHFNGTAFITTIDTREIDASQYESNREMNSEERAEVKAQELESGKRLVSKEKLTKKNNVPAVGTTDNTGTKNFITVDLTKVNQLMDLVGELVVSESMVTRNPEVEALQIDSFDKAARQHRFIIKEIQDAVMSMRMVPLDLTFQKMNRLVRDMSKKTNKPVNFNIIGAQTEVDKNVIEHIADPLMHIIRNAIDHGIESPEERKETQKPMEGNVTLEAKQSGGSVNIIVKDDGKGIQREKVLNKAESLGLLFKGREEYTDKEVFSMIFAPGFSTKEEVTEFSGRGVGMDVVTRNIEEVGGTVSIDSKIGKGSEFIIKIPLTLAIIEGMLVRVGDVIFSLPITSIQESMRISPSQLIVDNEQREMVMIRDECLPVIRLHNRYTVPAAQQAIDEGVLVMIENDHGKMMLFVDQMIGEQQLVVKRIPKYMQRVEGVSGCALLGDGRISLILDPSGLS